VGSVAGELRSPSHVLSVLALRWRPRTFEEVVGQQTVTRTLQNALSSGRIGHAFLLSGARGVGKTTTARILAKALNCSRGDKPTPRPCDKCPACQEITAGASLDVQRSTAPPTMASSRCGSCARARATTRPGTASRSGSSTRSTCSRPGPSTPCSRPGGASAPRQVHLRHHRVPQAPRHHPLEMPAVRVPDDPGPRALRSPAAGSPTRGVRVSDEALPGWPEPPRAACATPSRCSIRSSRSAGPRSRTRTSRPCWG